MNRELEAQRAKLKEHFGQEIDRFYDEIAKQLETRTLRIEDVERIMKEKKTRMSELMTESAGEAIKETEPLGKKTTLRVRGALEKTEQCTSNKNQDNQWRNNIPTRLLLLPQVWAWGKSLGSNAGD
jgi:oligoendopeptidase F